MTMKLPRCTYCGESTEGQAYHIVEQGGERRMRHCCERCLIRFFDLLDEISKQKERDYWW